MPNPFLSLAHAQIENLQPYQPGRTISSLKGKISSDSIIKLASNENPLGPSPLAQQAIIHALPQAALYPEQVVAAKQTLATMLNIDEHCITLGNGSENIIQMVIQAFNRPNSHCLIPQYAFSAYRINAHALNMEVRIIPSPQYGHDIASIIDQVSETTSLIFIDNPNNPIGTYLNHQALLSLLDAIPPTVLLVLDEAYFEFGQGIHDYPDSLSLLTQYPNLIILRTFSKVYGLAGLRIGYGIAHPDITDILNRVRLPFNVSSLALSAAIAAIEDQNFVEQTLAMNKQAQKLYQQIFKELKLVYFPSFANFITFDLKQDSDLFFEYMLNHGIIVRPLKPYGLTTHIRISTGLPEHNQRAIQLMKHYFGEMHV